MKKLLLILCACAILLSGTACKKNKEKDTNKETTNTPETEITTTVPETTETGEAVGTGDAVDTVEVLDTTVTDDTTVPADTTPADTTVSADTTVPADTTVSADTTVPADTTAKDTEPRETIDLDGDGISDGFIVEGETGFDPEEIHDQPIQGGEPTDETMSSETISDGGKESGLWPTEKLPEDVPAFDDYEEMYPAIQDDGDTATNWYLGVDATEEEYEKWLEDLKAAGYIESEKIVGFWGNGEQIINVYTEYVDDEFCVNIDIFKSDPVEYPEEVSKIFPTFIPSDSTLYGWYVIEDDPNLLSVAYACGLNFDKDLNAYKKTLADAGFTVSDNEATKTVDGKTYVVRYGDEVSAYEDCLEYEF